MLNLNEPSRYRLTELAAATGLEKSAIRYYLQNVLDGYIKTHFGEIKVEKRKAGLYPAQILDRLKFIVKAKEELKTASGDRINPSIAELRSWMSTITDEEIREVLYGTEPLEFGTARVENGKRIIETVKGEKLPAHSEKYGRQLPGHPANGSDTAWKRIRFGPNLEMRYRKPLTKKKMQQMEMICALAQSIMDEE